MDVAPFDNKAYARINARRKAFLNPVLSEMVRNHRL